MTRKDTKEMICISCPIGCHLTVRATDDEKIVVKGNKCARGKEYGEEEYRAPKRMVTCTCATGSDQFPRLPVRTVTALPKELIDDLLEELYRLTVALPVKRGQTVISDFRGTGVDVIATMSLTDHR